MRVLSLGQENSLEEGMATHSSYGLMVHLAAHHALPRDTGRAFDMNHYRTAM